MDGLNCRRLMKHHVDIIVGIIDVFIKMDKGVLSNEDIRLVINKYKILLK